MRKWWSVVLIVLCSLAVGAGLIYLAWQAILLLADALLSGGGTLPF